jgi:transposase
MISYMRSTGSPAELENRRLLAIRRLLEGFSTEEVAEFLEVERRSVQRWMNIFSEQGWNGLLARPTAGRPRKLNPTQEKIVLRWVQQSPTEFGFPTELWTCQHLTQVIFEEWGICLNSAYLSRWLRVRGITPQKPQRVPRERNADKIARWLATEWPRIKKKRCANRPTSF